MQEALLLWVPVSSSRVWPQPKVSHPALGGRAGGSQRIKLHLLRCYSRHQAAMRGPVLERNTLLSSEIWRVWGHQAGGRRRLCQIHLESVFLLWPAPPLDLCSCLPYHVVLRKALPISGLLFLCLLKWELFFSLNYAQFFTRNFIGV